MKHGMTKALYVAAGTMLLAGCAGSGAQTIGGSAVPSGTQHAAGRYAAFDLSRPLSVTRHVLGSNLRPSWMRFAPASAKATVYVSQFSGNTVNDYARRNKKNAPPLCQVNDQTDVNGIGVDRSGNLWVPVGGEFTGVVDEFGPSCGSQLFSIQVANGQPAAIAFDDKANVYVLNILDADFEGNIDVYVPGGTQPTTVLGDKESFRFFDEAIDASTNVYVAWADVYNKGHLDEFAGAADPVIHLPFEYGFPGGVALDTKGNLLVVDDDAILVDVLAPPYTGTPIATFPLKAASIPCRFTKPGAELYCSDYANSSVDVYRYDANRPGATTYLYSFNNGIARGAQNAGIAIAPAR